MTISLRPVGISNHAATLAAAPPEEESPTSVEPGDLKSEIESLGNKAIKDSEQPQATDPPLGDLRARLDGMMSNIVHTAPTAQPGDLRSELTGRLDDLVQPKLPPHAWTKA